MWPYLEAICARPWTGIYLRVLAVIMAWGAIVHYGNLLGFGEKPFSEAPLAWKLGDIFYAVVNTLAVIGLWQRSPWGLLLFLAAVGSQFVIYTVFIDHFALTAEHRKAIHGLLWLEGGLVAGLVVLAILRR